MSNKEEILLDGKAVNMLKETVGGTTVVANPELEGDEPNLTGLEVGGVKYKVPQGGIEFVEIDQDTTSINLETLEKLVDFNNHTLKPNFIVLTTKNETDTYPILMPSDTLQNVYRSAVMGDKYYQLTLDILEDSADVNIEQISVGGKDNRFLGLGFELKSALHNKHLSVNALLSLLENHGLDASNMSSLHIGSVVGDNNEYDLINASFDGSNSAIRILEEEINDGEYYNNINQGLIALKNLIEVTIIADGYFPMENLYCANLGYVAGYDEEVSIFISPEEIYELFTQ